MKYNVARFQAKMADGIANNKEPFATQLPISVAPPEPGETVDATNSDAVFVGTNFFNKVATAGHPLFTFASVSSSLYLPIFRAYQRAQQGQDSYYDDDMVLRHTTNASNRGYYNVADANVNKIYTQAQFLSEITNTSYWIFPCPNEILGALTVIFADLPAPSMDSIQSALKGGSPRTTTANNRVNITTTYEIGTWSTDTYRTL